MVQLCPVGSKKGVYYVTTLWFGLCVLCVLWVYATTHLRFLSLQIIFHSGPTNSGKTYNALERLKEANEGLYLGPLRLLAAEVYENLTSDGIYTNLFTGQERREIAFSTHAAATVEMVNLAKEYDVVVIDEIQMISE
jgi:ATP-dependent RNA helicase SUPV3L1/SUV3